MSIGVHIASLGCDRNAVDSEELAGRLEADGFTIASESDADVVVVNTCGFIDAAKSDSIDVLLEYASQERPVVAVGCLAQRYGKQLAEQMPEVASVLGFDDYPQIAERLRSVLAGEIPEAPIPSDRRKLLPISPTARSATSTYVPGHASMFSVNRKRLSDAAWAPLKISSGCDRRCAFCAIPTFRGRHISREIDDIVAEARWLASQGVTELLLVSENTTSYGKDLGSPRLLVRLLNALSEVDGIEWIRPSYLQPAELRPEVIAAICGTPRVVPYFDLSVQHVSSRLLRSMRRFGDADSFLSLLDSIRSQTPDAGIRSNVIVGFPSETDADVDQLVDFLAAANFDAVGVFGYSDEDGTEAYDMPGKVSTAEIARRVETVSEIADIVSAARAADRVGAMTEFLPESRDGNAWVGRCAHQGPTVDGEARTLGLPERALARPVAAQVTGSDGADLLVRCSVTANEEQR